MIKKLSVRNFRSLRNLTIELGPMNALVGPNNAGKSNIMRALDAVLGDSWPMPRSFDDKDFCRLSPGSPFEIAVMFDQPLYCSPEVCGFKLEYDGKGESCEYQALGKKENPLFWPNDKPKRVSNEMKSEVSLQMLSLDRQANQQIKYNKWTLYGKLIRHVESTLTAEQKEGFHKGVEEVFGQHIRPKVEDLETEINNHVKSQTGLDISLKMSPSDPLEVLSNLKPYVNENGHSVEAENVGAGVQSAMVVAMARVYSQIVKKPLMLAIEEPELFLHPHGCRQFYSTLKQLSEAGTQVIYTTHDRSFVNIPEYESVHIVRKIGGATTVKSGIGHPIATSPEMIHVTKFNDQTNEVFFADIAVLVEGMSDHLSVAMCLEYLHFSLDVNNITIIECGGIGAIPGFAEILKNFGIPVLALVDEDSGNSTTAKVISKIEGVIGSSNVIRFVPVLEDVFRFPKKPEKRDVIAIVTTFLENNNPPQVIEDLKKGLVEEIKKIKELNISTSGDDQSG